MVASPVATLAEWASPRLSTFAAAFFDHGHDELRRIVGPEYALEQDASRDLLTGHLAAPGAQTALDAVLRRPQSPR